MKVKGTMLKRLEGIIPSACIVFTDETCRILDEDATRKQFRYLLQHDIGALVVGGHAGEFECLDPQERKRVIGIAKEEAKGKVPVVGGVAGDSTREAIKKGLEAKEAGADAVLFCPPTIIGYDRETGGNFYVEHYAKVDQEVDLPIIMFGSPSLARTAGTYNIVPKTFKAIAERVENVVACKITARWDIGAFRATVRALKEVRDISCLFAGSSNMFVALMFGADGNLSGDGNYRVAEDVEIYRAIKSNDLVKAKTIQDRLSPLTDFVKDGRNSSTYFHYRYKVVAWLMGLIPRPHMRLPQLPPPLEEITFIREALLKAGMPVVREAEPLAIAST
jgi:4-hydroxy-tetrahydrodipicolinate synthase